MVTKTKEIVYPPIGGYHEIQELSSWPTGSIWEAEGKFLYDLVRKHKPKLVLEVGAYFGCSTTWIAQALIDNKKGRLISIDLNTYDIKPWSMVPEEVKKVIEFRAEDCFKTKVPKNIDMVFEDGQHTEGFSLGVYKRFPCKVFVSHDICHESEEGECVRKDWETIGVDDVFLQEPSTCGLAVHYEK